MKLSVKGYARHRAEKGMQGGTPAAVRKALERGQIRRDSEGLIDVAEADRDWPPALDRIEVSEAGELGRGTKGVQPAATDDDAISFTEARRRKEVALAQLRQLEVAEREGVLIHVDDAARDTARIAETLRAVLLAIPGKYAPRFVGLRDFREAQRALDDLVREVMAEMTARVDEILAAEAAEVDRAEQAGGEAA